MNKRKFSLNWETRLNDLYWDASLSETERVEELKEFILEERRNTIRDILNRIMNIPINTQLNDNQKMVVDYIRRWFNEECLPKIAKDYEIKVKDDE